MKKKLVVAILGLQMGRRHLFAAKEYGAEIGAICDIDTEKLAKYKEEYAAIRKEMDEQIAALAGKN